MRPLSNDCDEAERLDVLRRCNVLDTLPEADLDSLTDLAAEIAGCPIALISLVDEKRLWFKSRRGLETAELERTGSFCTYAIEEPEAPFVVADARRDPRFADHPLVSRDGGIVHYTGIALCLGKVGVPIGTLCVLDHHARTLTPRQLELLKKLAHQVELLLDVRLRNMAQEVRIALHRRQEEQLKAILAAVDEGIVVRDRDGKIEACNRSAERILGIEASQLRGVPLAAYPAPMYSADGAVLPPDALPSSLVLRTGQPVTGMIVGIGSDEATRRWILVNANPFHLDDDDAKSASGVIVSFADITALRREEAERRFAEAQVERFFTVALEPLCLASFDGRFLRVNPAWTTTLGWSEEELLATPFLSIVEPDDRPAAIAALASFEAGNATTVMLENRCRCKDGSSRTMSWRVAGVRSAATIVAVGRDVTAERAREAALLAAKEAAESAGRAKSEFLATMSHEIRTPMNGVLGLTEILLGTKLEEEQRELLWSVRESGQALLQVLNDILDWSRIEAGRLQIEREAVDPARVAKDVLTVLRAEAARKQLEVALEVDPGMKNVLADAGRLRQVLFNLVGNAIKFTEQGAVAIRLSRVPATARFPHGGCRFEIRDTGIGIAADDLKRLFERFSQVDASATRRFRGTGLGLAISRQLIDAMEGSIEVESCLGQGSTFVVVLPFTTIKRRSVVLREQAPPVQLPAQALRVLIAEDDPVNRKVSSSLVAREGHHVATAVDGRLAIDAYESGDWDVILMDVQMPELDGLQATRAIRAIEERRGRPRVPIVALTASVLPEERGACLDAGMDDVLAKPFTKDALRALLAHVDGRIPPSVRPAAPPPPRSGSLTCSVAHSTEK